MMECQVTAMDISEYNMSINKMLSVTMAKQIKLNHTSILLFGPLFKKKIL